MTDGDLVRIPCFIIPADDERLALFSERHDGHQLRVQLFDANDGVRRFTLDVYFGSILVCPGDDEGDRELITGVLNACKPTPDQDVGVIRLDYAYDCLSKNFELLRVGTPKRVPIPYSALNPDVVVNAERYIEMFMEKPHIDILANRHQAMGDERILLDGEETFLEGFLGDSGLPLVLPEDFEAELRDNTDEPTAAL